MKKNETKALIKNIIDAIQEKKGKEIVIADLSAIDDAICRFFIICQGNTPNQVSAIVESIYDFARDKSGTKPMAVDGLRNAQWVAMDYYDVIIHVFLPEQRKFYDIEHLWADAKLTSIPNLD